MLSTFNGPGRIAADVSSELLFDVTQTVFQRHTFILNSLIQSERDLVDAVSAILLVFASSSFLGGLVPSTAGLLRSYRAIEIDAQSDFANVRTDQQSLEEVQSGILLSTEPDCRQTNSNRVS
ncbi:MAG: hypothetical protein U5K37_05225 [Natrialbaceae archaeon]|nr:hypothetical protein [Natrialbaceae archaeon]